MMNEVHPSVTPRSVVAIDGGGTKTECLVASEDGIIVGYGRGGPVNLSFVDATVAAHSIEMALHGAIGGRCARVAVVALGATVAEEFVRPIVDRCLAYDTFINLTEAPTCLASATPATMGAAILAGTGAFAWARNGASVAHRTDGWGALMGDQGSAYDLVRRALIAAGRAVDGRGPETLLVARFCGHFDVPDLKAVSRAIYRGRLARHEIAALAPIVSAVAHEDAVARGLLHETGTLLAEGLATCIRRVAIEHEMFEVALCGGVFRAGETVVQPIADALAGVAPRATLIEPMGPPVIGALALALASLGHPPDRAALGGIGRAYRDVARQYEGG